MRLERLRLFQLRSQKYQHKSLQPSVGSDVIGSNHVFFISMPFNFNFKAYEEKYDKVQERIKKLLKLLKIV